MPPLSYSGYRFPCDIIQRAVWMYLRFTLSFRDVEELLAERGIVVTYESIRRWVLAFGPTIARRLRTRRPKPHNRWHLDEMFVRVGGKQMYLWRGLSRWAFLLVKGADTAHSGSRIFNGLAGSRDPVPCPKTSFTCPT